MEKLKKALRWSCSNNEEDCRVGGKCNGSSSGASEGEEGDIFREPLNTNGHSSRKRVKLQGKASEDYIPVDLAVVPRKLRSAINKRLSQSASPPLSDSKRRQLHTLNGTQTSTGCIAERYRQNTLDQVTKDEEEVAEALTALASSITISMPKANTDKRRNLEENSETKATSTSPSEGLHEVVLEAEPSALEQPIAASITQNFNASGIETTPANSDLTLLSNIRKESDITCLRGAMNSSDPLGTSLQYLAGNGGLQQAQLDASSMQKRDLGLWHLGSASMEKDLPSVKQNLVISGTSPYLSKREATGGWLGLPSTDHAQLTISKTTGSQRSITASTRCSSTRNDLPTEALPPPTTDKRTPCKRCATHVYISHLVRNYQNAEKKQRSSLPNNQSKEGSPFLQTSTTTIGLRNGMIPLSSGFHMERSSLEGSSRMVQDGRLVQAHMASTLSGAYAQQKHGGDHFSISAVGDAKNSENGLQPSGQLPVHYLQHHSLMSFPFAGGPYSSHYQDQLTAAATQQVPMQMQRPHYMITGPLYESQMVQVTGGTATKQQQQQQQMWQAQLAHYGHQLGFQAKQQQNGHHPDSFQPSSSLHTRGPPAIFPLPKDFHAPNGQPHFLLPRPSSSSSLPSRPKQQHQHNGGGFNLESSSQLQMLCNAETFR